MEITDKIEVRLTIHGIKKSIGIRKLNSDVWIESELGHPFNNMTYDEILNSIESNLDYIKEETNTMSISINKKEYDNH